MVDGILLKLDTSAAVKSQESFDAATKATFVALEKQSKELADLEAKLRAAAAATDAATESEKKRKDALGKPSPVPGTVPGAPGAPVPGAPGSPTDPKKLGDEARRAASGINALSQSSASATGFVTKLFAASGNQGAARGVGLLGAGVRALALSINPLGLVTGIAAGALITFAANALRAKTNSEKLSEANRQTQASFSILNDVVGKASSSLSSLAQARQGIQGFRGDATAAIAAIGEVITKGNEAIRDLSTSASRLPGFELNIEQVKQFGEILNLTALDYRDLDKAATASGKEQQDAIDRLAQSGIRLKAVQEGNLFSTSKQKTVTLDAAEAIRILEGAITKLGTQQVKLRNEQNASTKPFDDLTKSIIAQADAEKLGAKEREAKAKIDEILAGRTGELNDKIKASVAFILDNARATDQAAAAADRLKRAQQVQGAISGKQQDVDLLREEGDARLLLATRTELENAAKAAQVPINQALQVQIDKVAQALVDATRADRERTKAAQEAKQLAEEQRQSDERRADAIRQLREDTELLLATTEDEAKAKRNIIELNDLLSRTGTRAGSAGEAELRRLVDAKQKAQDFNQQLGELRRLGEESFGAIGQQISDAALNGGTFRSFLQGVARDLQAIALQRLVVDQLVRLGGAAVVAIAGGGNSPAATTSPSPGSFYGYARGGVLPQSGMPQQFAARGLVLDRFQTFLAGGRAVTAAEGGASTPEAILPLERDRYGRLGVQASGGGGTTIINMPSVRNGDEARRIRPTLRQTIEAVNRADVRSRGGLRAGR